MTLWQKVKRSFVKYFNHASGTNIALVLLGYVVITWALLYAVGEISVTSPTDFVYYIIVTTSTVGYGDFSPTTDAGKWVVSLFVIPVGLSLFALVIGRIAAWLSRQWQLDIRGLKSIMNEQHILILGWNDERTIQLLQLLLKERQQSTEKVDIVLCVKADIENPMPGEIEFVRVSSFNREEDMNKANVNSAKTILIDNPHDDITMTTALFCSKHNPNAHIVAYFNDESLVSLLQQHCPNVECTPSVAVEMLAKSAFDPGSSLLHHDLLSVADGHEQYSTIVPQDVGFIEVSDIFIQIKHIHDAIFIGYAKADDKQHIIVNPSFDTQIHPGDRVFYIARSRINDMQWHAFVEGIHNA
ncbi:MAG: two pore domain potassium channel family protein [Alteromonadaceae bacterium]|nr:two pore domain potassium channel family protein [Alteromonadaceae bacterium]